MSNPTFNVRYVLADKQSRKADADTKFTLDTSADGIREYEYTRGTATYKQNVLEFAGETGTVRIVLPKNVYMTGGTADDVTIPFGAVTVANGRPKAASADAALAAATAELEQMRAQMAALIAAQSGASD